VRNFLKKSRFVKSQLLVRDIEIPDQPSFCPKLFYIELLNDQKGVYIFVHAKIYIW